LVEGRKKGPASCIGGGKQSAQCCESEQTTKKQNMGKGKVGKKRENMGPKEEKPTNPGLKITSKNSQGQKKKKRVTSSLSQRKKKGGGDRGASKELNKRGKKRVTKSRCVQQKNFKLNKPRK